MIISVAQAQIFFLVLTRVLAILVQAPIFGNQSIPSLVKLGLGFGISILIVPWKPLPAETQAIPLLTFGFAVLQELIIGVLAGFAVSLIFAAFQIAGSVMDMVSGFSAAQIFNPAFGETGALMDQFYMMVAMLFFLLINGHHYLLAGVKRTFDLIPVMSPLPSIPPERIMYYTNGFIASGVQMALPILVALFFTDITMGLLAKVAPQINVFFLGLPVKIWVALVSVSLSLNYLMPRMYALFQQIGPRMIGILGA